MEHSKLPSRTALTSAHQRSKSPQRSPSTAPEAPATGPTVRSVSYYVTTAPRLLRTHKGRPVHVVEECEMWTCTAMSDEL